MENDIGWSVKKCIDIFGEFLLVSIHCILYARRLYPQDLFIKARKYNTIVWQSRHPILCEYIEEVVQSCTEELQTGSVHQVALSIINKEQQEEERYVFSTDSIPIIPDFLLEKQISTNEPFTDAYVEYMRASLIQLLNITNGLPLIEQECTWTLRVTLKDGFPRPKQWEEWFLPPQTRETDATRQFKGITIPVRNVDIGPMMTEIWVEKYTNSD